MSAHGVDHEPDGKMSRRTVTDFEPGRRFVWSTSLSGGQLHRREMLSPVLAGVMSYSNTILGDPRRTSSNAIS